MRKKNRGKNLVPFSNQLFKLVTVPVKMLNNVRKPKNVLVGEKSNHVLLNYKPNISGL